MQTTRRAPRVLRWKKRMKIVRKKAEKNTAEEIARVRDVLYLVVAALRKLPVVSGITLYRGIRCTVSRKLYKEGNTVVWPGFSSTSPNMGSIKAFLNKIYNSNNSDRNADNAKSAEGVEMAEEENENENEKEKEEEEEEEENGEGGEERSCGTLFIIEDGWGYNVQPYSQYPEEEEILLEPEREFEVTSVTESEGLLLVTLSMKNTSVIFPKVFGNVRR